MGVGAHTSRRDDVLRLLDEADGPLTVAALAEALGTHQNTVRFHLERLLGDGLVERTFDDRGVPGRPAQLFHRVRKMDGAAGRRYRMLAEILVDQLADTPDPTAKALEAGRRWGSREAAATPVSDPREGLVEMLGRIGFDPDPDAAAAGCVQVRHCPFLELARERPQVVCAIHLGLMRGALATWGADVTVDRLERHEQPDVCVARLTAPAASDDPVRR